MVNVSRSSLESAKMSFILLAFLMTLRRLNALRGCLKDKRKSLFIQGCDLFVFGGIIVVGSGLLALLDLPLDIQRIPK